MSTRQEKVEELLKVEISEIIQREMKDPRLGFVTITEVKVSPDLRHARVFVSVMGDEEQKKVSVSALNRAAGFVRGELGKRLSMRVTPELDFRIDTSIEHGAKIFELLEKIKKDESEQG
ncbi:MAG: 30S ribosome-binding factor RbfA [Armatimonadetes bacterium]|nr:30S ribosome-binding factor RbfA [Armatimonadota bacterium]